MRHNKRTPLGTFKPRFDEEMVNLTIRIPKKYKERWNKIPNKTDYLRTAILKAIENFEEGNS